MSGKLKKSEFEIYIIYLNESVLHNKAKRPKGVLDILYYTIIILTNRLVCMYTLYSFANIIYKEGYLMGSSKRKSELKGKVTSIRLSQEQHESVKAKAKAKGMSLSNYIITSAVNGGNNISPDLLVKIQNLTNTACMIAEK